jgi:hypothetical protein
MIIKGLENPANVLHWKQAQCMGSSATGIYQPLVLLADVSRNKKPVLGFNPEGTVQSHVIYIMIRVLYFHRNTSFLLLPIFQAT